MPPCAHLGASPRCVAALAAAAATRAPSARSVRSPSAGCRTSPTAAQCGTLEVPEDRAQAGRPQDHDLRRGAAGEHADAEGRSAACILAGGPGQAATLARAVRRAPDRGAAHARHRAGRPARHRPLVAARLRGVQAATRRTTRSNRIRCPARAPAWRSSRRAASTPRSTRRPRGSPTSKRCARRSATRSWNLWGGTYGTRVALEYLRRHPDRVRSDDARRRRAAVAEDLARRLADARSGARRPLRGVRGVAGLPRRASRTWRRRSTRIRATLGPAGREVDVVDPRTGERRDAHASRSTSCSRALQPLTYVPELAALLPEMLARAARRRLRPALRRRAAGRPATSPSR